MQLKEGKFYINRGGNRVYTPLIVKGYGARDGAMGWQMDGTYNRTPGSAFDLVAEFDTREDAMKFMIWQKTMVGEPPVEPADRADAKGDGRPVSEGRTYPTSPEDILSARARTHGDYAAMAKTFEALSDVMNAACPLKQTTPGQRFAIFMILVKLARIANGDPDYADHWDDVAGYARLGRDSKGEG
jgi:hypothetical protein